MPSFNILWATEVGSKIRLWKDRETFNLPPPPPPTPSARMLVFLVLTLHRRQHLNKIDLGGQGHQANKTESKRSYKTCESAHGP